MNNLLKNPSFEGGVSYKNFTSTKYGEISSPDEWLFWWSESAGYRRPESRVTTVDPVRIRSGRQAFMAFTTFGKQLCGLFQEVHNLSPGAKYNLVAFAHAWSSHQDELATGDPHCSIGVGCSPVWIAPEDVPPLNGDPINDAIGNFTFQVGVGFGSPDPFSDNITWGDGACIYNAYSQSVPPISFFAPDNGIAVIYLRSTSLWAYKNSDAYWDDISLTLSTECRGRPREQYERVYELLPPDVTREEAHRILDQNFDKRHTIGFSADDAGVGDLDVRKVIAHRPSSWPNDLKAFFDTYYPGVQYEPVNASEMLTQCDARWKDYHYGEGQFQTMCAKGCWITDVANTLRLFDIDDAATPVTVDEAVGREGYNSTGEMLWDAMPPLGLQVVKNTIEAAVAKNWLDAGNVCFAEVKPPSMLHFVLLTEHTGDRFWMIDPLSGKETWLDEVYWGIESWRLVRKVVPPVSIRPVLGFQQQRAENYRDEFISRTQPPVWMLIGGFEEAAHLKSLAPDMDVVLRHVDDDWKSYILADDKDAAAERWIRHYGSTLFNQAENIDYVLDLNEYIATNDYEALQATPFWIEALVKRFEKEGWPARIIGLNPGVGNPQSDKICDQKGIPRQVPILTPAARLLTDNDCPLGYHAYFGCRRIADGQYYCTLDEDVNKYYAMRALYDWDPVFRAAGVFPTYAFTEGGAIYIDEGGGTPSSEAGWKYQYTLAGDINAYIKYLLKFQKLVQEWNGVYGDRAKWLAIFIHGGYNWELFDMAGEPSKLLADALCS